MADKSVLDEATRYLASTLHEIRTPIQTIIGTLELLKETNLDKEQHEYIRQIQFSADVLLDLANNILDFSKIRSNEFKLEYLPFNITELTEQVVDLISIEAFNRGLEIITDIDFSIPPIVIGDPVRVQQIILNLLKNAVKFTHKGYIHAELKNEKTQLLFKVTDTGIGITEEQKSKLFTNYYQGDISTYRKFGGTGLGLSISKNLVTVMKGKIGVEQNSEGGAIFWFKLPLNEAENITNFSKTEKLSIPCPQKILVVDDNSIAANSLLAHLKHLGFSNIISTNSPTQAIDILIEEEQKGSPFTLAFIDMIMPVMDGWRLGNEIHNNPKIKNAPSLYLLVPEGQMRSEAKMKMLDWFKGYLYKPFKRRRVFELLKNAFTDGTENLEELELADEDAITSLKVIDDSEVANGKKILIAEDHPVNRKLLETFVKKFGAEVYLAEDGQQAIDVIRKNPDIDLIFMDIQMPVKNGIEATEEIRKFGYDGIIVACTANNDKNDFDAYQQIGINDIIVKPFKSKTIRNVLENWATIMELPALKAITTLQPSTSESLSAWDKEDFLDTVGGDKKLAITIISTYIKQTQEILANVDSAVEREDFIELRKIGHALSGSSATVSAKKLAEYSSRLNKAAKEGDKTACIFNINEFQHEFSQLQKLVKIYIEENRDSQQ
ncbi:hybrid sensor histidine kinase/response regulator [Treponema pectinovorum]|uniref:hybrid sensor histidine kinase/response regulator n=1 Tax=Treponema pectinovorum TaxID=164 RepID=UPI0011C93165|nr:hybrid sensor histidine kinase/response regulator [Treponema pectinovorum]